MSNSNPLISLKHFYSIETDELSLSLDCPTEGVHFKLSASQSQLFIGSPVASVSEAAQPISTLLSHKHLK